MNIQKMMSQAKKMQQEILEKQEKVNKTVFDGKSELVNVEVTGSKEVLKIEIKNKNELNNDDLEILEDMIMIAINDAFKKVDKELEQLSNGMPGLNNLF